MMAVTSLQEFLPQLLGNHDTKKRLQLGMDLLAYLENPLNSLECEEPGLFVDGLVSWLNSSNFKVSQNGLEALTIIVDRMKEDFRPYISTVLPAAADRLGDSKDQVRAQAKTLLLSLMSTVSTPQPIFEKLTPAFNHKNFRVREEIMLLLQETLVRNGAQSLTISKLMPHIVKLLGDPNSQVRDTATQTLVEVYKHVGEMVRKDLGKKYPVAAPKLQAILLKFDEVKNAGEVNVSANSDYGHRGEDDIDSKPQIVRSTSKRVSSAPPTRRTLFAPSSTSASSVASAAPKVPISVVGSSSAAGGADEELFIRSFTDVPRVQLYSGRELEQELTKIRETLSDNHCDWEKRVDTMKIIRSLLVAGATDYDELSPNLKLMEPAFQMSVKDLRSQVVREACITIAFLAQQMGPRLDHFAEAVLPNLINLIPNCAKIMSSAGTVAIRFIIQHTHVSRLIPIIAYNLSSKSKDIRKTCSEFLDQLLHTWPTHTLEKHVALLQDAIKKGISDADPDARLFSRKAYWGFADHFRDQADSLLNSLDSSKQRMLQGECMSNSSSNNSLNSTGAKTFRSSASAHGGSVENLSRVSGQRSGIPIFSTKSETTMRSPFGPPRSNSAIDMGAARRAKSRASRGMFALASLPRGSGASLPRSVSRKTDNVVSAITSPERIGRSRSKGVSHSQPSSRSGSPSSRLSYATYQLHSAVDGTAGTPTTGRVRRRSGIPTAGGTSRDTSPTRNSYERRLSNSSFHGGRTAPVYSMSSSASFSPSLEAPVPVLNERILPGNKEAEDAVADALVSGWHRMPVRKRYNAFDDQSDESETSSVCSDRSYGSYGGRAIDDVADIIHCLMSVQWKDRKEGLLGLQMLLQANHPLTAVELRKITDIFTRLFMDPHMKVFTLFLDTLHDLIVCHKHELRGWLFPLITRILLKLGSDILPSLHSKILQTLELIRDSFPHDEQFNAMARFINDPTQTHNMKVKAALLNYLHSLLLVMDAREFSASHPDTKMAISKIISWSADPKGVDLKKSAQDVIVALFKLNTPEFSILLNQSSKLFQDSAFKLINTQMGRRSSSSTDSSPSLGGGGSLRSPSSPIMSVHSANTGLPRMRSRSGTPQNSSFEYDDTENLVPEDYYHCLRKTSAEIQKYSQDSLDHDPYLKESSPRNKLGDLVGPVSSPQGDRPIKLEDNFSDTSSPTKRSPYDYNPNLYKDQNTRNAFNMQSLSETVYEAEMDIADDFPVAGGDSKFKSIMTELNNHNVRNEQRKVCLQQLIRLTKEGAAEEWEEHFREILRLLKDTISDSDASVRALALRALCELIQRQPERFHGYIEMTVLKILEAQKDPDRDVIRAAELCSANAACYLPPEHCVRTLKSIIMTEGYGFSIHQAAIKMITKMVEHHPKNVVMQLLPEMMPALVQAYDHQESCVRKAAVFCMVDIHGLVGDSMKPHLLGLNGSKLKLLSVYIKRSQSQGTGSTGQGDSTSQLNSR